MDFPLWNLILPSIINFLDFLCSVVFPIPKCCKKILHLFVVLVGINFHEFRCLDVELMFLTRRIFLPSFFVSLNLFHLWFMILYLNFTINWVNFLPPYIFFSIDWVFNSSPGFKNFNLKSQPFVLQGKFSYLFIHFPMTSVFRFSYSIWFYTHPVYLLKRGYFYFVVHLVIFLQFILWFLFL